MLGCQLLSSVDNSRKARGLQLLSSVDSPHRMEMAAAIFIGQAAQGWGWQSLSSVIRARSGVAVDIFSRQSITEICCMVIAIFRRQSTHGIEVAIAVISTQSPRIISNTVGHTRINMINMVPVILPSLKHRIYANLIMKCILVPQGRGILGTKEPTGTCR